MVISPYNIARIEVWVGGLVILLMVQKSQTTTWNGAKTLKIMG